MKREISDVALNFKIEIKDVALNFVSEIKPALNSLKPCNNLLKGDLGHPETTQQRPETTLNEPVCSPNPNVKPTWEQPKPCTPNLAPNPEKTLSGPDRVFLSLSGQIGPT